MENNLPTDPQALTQLSQQTIDGYEKMLTDMQNSYIDRVDKIRTEGHERINATSPDGQQERQAILEEMQNLLNEAQNELSQELARADEDFRKKLESIEKKQEDGTINLDKELAQL